MEIDQDLEKEFVEYSYEVVNQFSINDTFSLNFNETTCVWSIEGILPNGEEFYEEITSLEEDMKTPYFVLEKEYWDWCTQFVINLCLEREK